MKKLVVASSRKAPFIEAHNKILDLMAHAVGVLKELRPDGSASDLDEVMKKLDAITSAFFPSGWPDDVEPLPAARLSMALLYLGRNRPEVALRLALQGALWARSRSGPFWVHDLMDVFPILLVTGSLDPDFWLFKEQDKADDSDTDAAETKATSAKFPSTEDSQNVAYGYLREACREAFKIYGSDSNYCRGLLEMYLSMATKKRGVKVDSQEFVEEFQASQKRLLAYAGVPEERGVVLQGR